jgi:hypothetical protein
MSLIFNPGVEDKIVAIASSGSLNAQREVAKVFAYLKRLDDTGAASSPFWNVVDAARGRLTSERTCPGGNAIWRLYASHAHCVALLFPKDGDIVVLHVCGKNQVSAFESSYC